jgi:hypothetical protein
MSNTSSSMPYSRVKISFFCDEDDLDKETDVVENVNDIYQVSFECQTEGTENYFLIGPCEPVARLIADLSEAMNERQLNRTDKYEHECEIHADDTELKIEYEYQTEILTLSCKHWEMSGNFSATSKVHRRYIVNELKRKLSLPMVEL